MIRLTIVFLTGVMSLTALFLSAYSLLEPLKYEWQPTTTSTTKVQINKAHLYVNYFSVASDDLLEKLSAFLENDSTILVTRNSIFGSNDAFFNFIEFQTNFRTYPYKHKWGIVPLWFLFFIIGLYPTYWMITGPLRRLERRRRGLCVSCGYDLKCNESGVCPECGKEIIKT